MLRMWWTIDDGRTAELVFGTDSDAALRAAAIARRARRPCAWRLATAEETWNRPCPARDGATADERRALRHDPEAPPAPGTPQFWMLVASGGARVPYFGTAEEALTTVLRGLDEGRYVAVEPATRGEARGAQAALRSMADGRSVRTLSAAAATLVLPATPLAQAH